ncbi:MAG TPA: DUF2589 domain-containing protein [candidate division Zixibacteria bacterium]|nr:DUF2589 domain-containing protein [candidate division Zixibacteria bacterium]
MADLSFHRILEGITNAILHARRVVENQNQGLLRQFFDSGPDSESLRAKVVVIHVPSMTEAGKTEPIEVPLVTLVPLSGLEIADVTIEFKAEILGLDDAEAMEKGAKEKQLFLGLKGGGSSKKSNEVSVKVTVKGTDPPEGLVRINQHILKQIP